MSSFFTENERTQLFDRILQIGQSDQRVTGGALVGSFAQDTQDEWSDIDISFGIQEDESVIDVLGDWTKIIETEFDLIHFFDVPSSKAIYRVFLLSNGIEVDLSAVPESEYGPKAPCFKLLFGKAGEEEKPKSPSIDGLYGWSWHHVMHANSAINRGKNWQAQFWISSLRNHIISLKCLRLGYSHAHGRGVDQLPEDELKNLELSLIGDLNKDELRRCLRALSETLITEIRNTNPGLAGQLSSLFKQVLK